MPVREPSIGKSAGDRALVRGFAARDFYQLLAEARGGVRFSSANWRQVYAMPASRNIGCTPVASLTSLKLGASPATARRACKWLPVVIAAIAREMAAFLWAIARHVAPAV